MRVKTGFIKNRRLMLCLAVLAAIFFIDAGHCATSTGNVSANVKVAAVFTMTVDTSSISFGSLKPGYWKELPDSGSGYVVTCKSNNGNTWYLKIKGSAPFSSLSESFSLSGLKWMSTYAGNKNDPYTLLSDGLSHKPESGYVDLTLLDETVYASGGVSAFNDNSNLPSGTEVQFKYAMQVPDSPAPLPGDYSTTVVFTMTE